MALNWSPPAVSSHWFPVWRRNLHVWAKLSGPALVGHFIEPLLTLLAFGYGLGGFIGAVEGLPYAVFLASGILCGSAMNTATFEGLYSAYTRMSPQRTWEGLLATPIHIDDIVFAETLWAGTKSLISAVAILTVAALLGLVASWQALWALPIILLTGVCYGALALVITAYARSYDFFVYYFTLVITPMFLLSGVFFPLEQMPHWVQTGAAFVPLTHVVAIVRPLMTGGAPENILLHLAVPLLYTLAALYLATALFRRRMQA